MKWYDRTPWEKNIVTTYINFIRIHTIRQNRMSQCITIYNLIELKWNTFYDQLYLLMRTTLLVDIKISQSKMSNINQNNNSLGEIRKPWEQHKSRRRLGTASAVSQAASNGASETFISEARHVTHRIASRAH